MDGLYIIANQARVYHLLTRGFGYLAFPHGGARRGISTHSTAIDVKLNAWVSRLVCSWECNQMTRSTTPSPSNCDLTACDVELCTTSRASTVQTDMFSANKIIATGKTLRDGEREAGLAWKNMC